MGRVPGSMHRLFSRDKIQSEKPLRLEVDQLEEARGRGDVIQGQGGHARRRCGEVVDPKPPTSLPQVVAHLTTWKGLPKTEPFCMLKFNSQTTGLLV